MTPSELTKRVTLDTCAAVGALAALGWGILGTPVGLRVLTSDALAVMNFH